MNTNLKPIIILGPTCSGKSALALDLANNHQGIVINADSMQLYQNFPILSAHPSSADFNSVPHKLYGYFDAYAAEHPSVARWLGLALHEMQQAQDKGHVPILVGGTGLYIKALLEGLPPMPEVPLEVRTHIQFQLQDQEKRQTLFTDLQEKDPESAEKLNINDTQRLLRALSILEHTGQPLSYWQKRPQTPPLKTKPTLIVLQPNRERLYQRINARTQHMLATGAIEEVKNSKNVKATIKPSGLKTIGVSEIQHYLSGDLSYAKMMEDIQTQTRRYAKRQYTWIRHQVTPDLMWEDIYESHMWERFWEALKAL